MFNFITTSCVFFTIMIQGHNYDAKLNIHLGACIDSPCKNGGTCFRKPEGRYSCTCPKDCEGNNCERCKKGMECSLFVLILMAVEIYLKT